MGALFADGDSWEKGRSGSDYWNAYDCSGVLDLQLAHLWDFHLIDDYIDRIACWLPYVEGTLIQ